MKHSGKIGLLFIIPSFAFGATTTFYGGLAGGAALYTAEINKTGSSVTISLPSGSIISQNTLPYIGDTDNFSGVGQIQFGAGITLNKLYLGAEVLGQVSNSEYDTAYGNFVFNGIGPDYPTSVFSFDANLHMRDFEPAIDFKPGFFFYRDSLIYARVGAAFNELTLKLSEQQNLVKPQGLDDYLGVAHVDAEESQDVVGLRLGLGLEHKLAYHLSLFADYTFTSYEDISLATVNSVPISFGGDSDIRIDNNNDLKASDIQKQVIMVGVNYHF